MITRKIVATLAIVAIPIHVYAVSFQPLGDLPGGGFGSIARGISADGLVVVGSSDSDRAFSDEAMRWSESTGLIGLGDLDGGPFASAAHAVSGDGSVVVGQGHRGTYQEAFRWTQSGGMVGLGVLPGIPGNVGSDAASVSGDGSVVVGGSGATDMSNTSRPFRWTESTRMVNLGLPLNALQASASDVSADGTVIVGTADYSNDIVEAFLWTELGGFIGLGDLSGADEVSAATGVSGDGQVVVGHSNSDIGGEPFRWTLANGMIGLGDLPGGTVNGVAWATDSDGSIIVGQANVGIASPNGDAAFIWDEVGGMRNLQNVLEVDYGIDLTGWVLISATGVSADGNVVTGNGFNPDGDIEAWVVVIPEPTSWVLFLASIGCAALRRHQF